jgi:hypothetical protein
LLDENVLGRPKSGSAAGVVGVRTVARGRTCVASASGAAPEGCDGRGGNGFNGGAGGICGIERDS